MLRGGLVLATAAAGLALAGPAAAPGSPPACNGTLDHGVIPVWSRTGFSQKRPRLAHAVGRRGEIAALVFGDPLSSPPARDRNNKILWVERRPSRTSTALWIRAQRLDGVRPVGSPVTRIVPHAPGPSIIDLPAAGCWRLTLSWSGRRDSLDLLYRSGP